MLRYFLGQWVDQGGDAVTDEYLPGLGFYLMLMIPFGQYYVFDFC